MRSAQTQTSDFRLPRRLSHRRRPAPRVSESRRRLLSVQRRRGGGRACCRTAASSASPSSISTSTTATARRSSSSPIRACSRFSMHQQHNYPMWKPRGSLDIGLPDGAHDATLPRELERALPQVMAQRPQCVFYLAGADPYEDDQLGGLRLTKDGLRQRDRMVFDAVRGRRRAAGGDAGRRLRAAARGHGRDPRGDDRRSGTSARPETVRSCTAASARTPS